LAALLGEVPGAGDRMEHWLSLGLMTSSVPVLSPAVGVALDRLCGVARRRQHLQ
jgi:hypothetical protein